MNIRTKSCCCSVNKDNSTNIYSFEVGAQGGKTLKLSELKGKVLLIVNTASRCGFTPQYAELEQLYKSYHENGFEILDFPCNQFGGQSPEDDAERTTFCKLNYGTTFPQLKKIEVNGDNASPLYEWLKAERGFEGFDEGHPLSEKLDEILTRHPEMEFVQLQINYADWEDATVQSRKCYEIARKYNKPVIAFSGCVTRDAYVCNNHGIDAFFPIARGASSLEEAMNPDIAFDNMADTAEQVFRLINM